MTKNERQEVGANLWRNAKGRGGLKYPTGFGKTYTTLNVIIKKMMDKNPQLMTTIIVAKTNLQAQWTTAIKKIFPERTSQFKVLTVQYMQMNSITLQNSPIMTNLVVIDEVDEFYSEDRKQVYDSTWIKYNYLLWLSATPETKDNRHREFIKEFPIVDEILRDEALANGWIQQYKAFNLVVEFTEDEQFRYDQLTELISNLSSKFAVENSIGKELDNAKRISQGFDYKGTYIPSYEAARMWAEKQGWSYDIAAIAKAPRPQYMKTLDYDSACATHAQWNPNIIRGYAKQLFDSLRERKYLCYKANNKKQITIDLIKRLNQKTIIFSQSTEFADNIYYTMLNKLPDVKTGVYHSNVTSRPLRTNSMDKPSLTGHGDFVRIKSKKSENYNEPKMFGADTLNKMTLQAFGNNELQVLVAGTALDKGLDVPDVTLGIATSFNSTATQYIQRRGRLTRIDIETPQDVILVNLYVPNTTEEWSLRNTEGKEAYWITDSDNVHLGYEETLDFIF